jgi:phosphopantothenoylcysteine decarboxylase/phosphopantothenate--cysteine ligase
MTTDAFRGRCVLLGVTGGVAAYKAAEIASRLVKAGADVDVIMTDAAQRFVTPLTFESLTHRPVHTGLWAAREVEPNHISLAVRADLLLVAPATADTMATVALGLAGDLLACVALATRAPILLAPAMNDNMWAHPATQAHAETLAARGVRMVGPVAGRLASGREGAPGRMAEPAEIVAAAAEILGNGGAVRA